MSVPSDIPPYGRALTIKPRRRGYRHRDIIAIRDGIGVTEHGEVIDDVIGFAMAKDSHIFLTFDGADLLNMMTSAHTPDLNYQVIDTREADVPDGVPVMASTRLTRFGWSRTGGSKRHRKGRHKAMHIVWCIPDMMRNPTDLLGDGSMDAMLQFGINVRDWCKDNDVPLPTALSGIAASLLRDPRFYPDARGRVPKATNERVRRFLPGVYSELCATPMKTYNNAVALDQRRAYHRAAQTTPLPDSTTLFARGYFNMPEDSPLWAKRDSDLYNRTIAQPGLVAVRVTSRATHKREARPPAINYTGTETIYLWTNEVPLCEERGAIIHGIVAAWTSTLPDAGLAKYGAWCEDRIKEADTYTLRWLKPTLHASYGLLAGRPRDLRIGHRIGRGEQTRVLLGNGHTFPIHETHLGAQSNPITNVPALGILQAEIRQRTMRLANDLTAEGVDVLHVHADGLHTTGALPLLNDNEWSIEARSNLYYIDRVSWLSDEGDCLPGRDTRQRIETRRHIVNVLNNRRR